MRGTILTGSIFLEAWRCGTSAEDSSVVRNQCGSSKSASGYFFGVCLVGLSAEPVRNQCVIDQLVRNQCETSAAYKATRRSKIDSIEITYSAEPPIFLPPFTFPNPTPTFGPPMPIRSPATPPRTPTCPASPPPNSPPPHSLLTADFSTMTPR